MKPVKERIRNGDVERRDVVRRLAELAFGRVNDCVKLALEEKTELDKLDLSLLAEVKRSEKGTVEIRLVDRLKVLEQLQRVLETDGRGVEGFFQGLQGGEEG